MHTQVIIYLDDALSGGTKILTGKDKGIRAREESHLDELEEYATYVVVAISSDILAITPSFFEAFFRNVVIKLGKKQFFEKFRVTSFFERPFKEAIERITRDLAGE